MTTDTKEPELTDEERVCRQVLIARTGWGRNQATKFLAELLPNERAAIAKCGLAPEHAAAAKKLLDEVTDRVLERRGKAETKQRAAQSQADYTAEDRAH